jgi:hypothetical protein
VLLAMTALYRLPALAVLIALLGVRGAAGARPATGAATLAAGGIIAKSEDAPWFCHDLDCPKYTVVSSTYALYRLVGADGQVAVPAPVVLTSRCSQSAARTSVSPSIFLPHLRTPGFLH